MKKLTHLATIFVLFSLAYQCAPAGEEADVDETEAYFDDFLPAENKWGFLDTTGNLIIPPRFDQVGSFAEGLCPVNSGGKWGYIDSLGNWVIEPQYKGAWGFHRGLARVWKFTDDYAFIHANNQEIIHPDYAEVNDFTHGRIRVSDGERTGFLDLHGNLVIPLQYQSASDFSRAGVSKVKLDNKYGMIDTTGRMTVRAEYEWMGTPGDRYLTVRIDHQYALLDMSNGKLLDGRYQQVAEPMDRRIAVKKNDQWSILDTDSGREIPIKGDPVQGLGLDRWAAYNVDAWDLLDGDGNVLNGKRFKQINRYQEGLACCRQGDYWGYLAPDGKLAIRPTFGLAWDFVNGFARVAGNKGTYFLNPHGEELYQSDWLDLRDFVNGRCPVQIRN